MAGENVCMQPTSLTAWDVRYIRELTSEEVTANVDQFLKWAERGKAFWMTKETFQEKVDNSYRFFYVPFVFSQNDNEVDLFGIVEGAPLMRKAPTKRNKDRKASVSFPAGLNMTALCIVKNNDYTFSTAMGTEPRPVLMVDTIANLSYKKLTRTLTPKDAIRPTVSGRAFLRGVIERMQSENRIVMLSPYRGTMHMNRDQTLNDTAYRALIETYKKWGFQEIPSVYKFDFQSYYSLPVNIKRRDLRTWIYHIQNGDIIETVSLADAYKIVEERDNPSSQIVQAVYKRLNTGTIKLTEATAFVSLLRATYVEDAADGPTLLTPTAAANTPTTNTPEQPPRNTSGGLPSSPSDPRVVMSGGTESKLGKGSARAPDPDLHMMQLDRAYAMRGRKKIYTI